ncbi:MAG TPA: hypothetical protein VG269_16555 [Tepidisphaeraceae bacterium]|jgi:mannitol/fructose-specific phosphotransferase system IIA component|nr:hypothetical protein [Tepidisphaeraceae bacterium]
MTSLLLQDIGLKPAHLKAIQKKARDAGTTAPEYVRSLIERELLSDKSFDEILRPVRDDFKKAGVTEAQLDGIVERARHAAQPRPRRRGSVERVN